MPITPDFKAGALRIVPSGSPKYAAQWRVEEYRRGFIFFGWFHVAHADHLDDAKKIVEFMGGTQ